MAIQINTTFTLEEVKTLFQEAGLTVELREVPYEFEASNRPVHTELIPTWVVLNPYTGEAENLEIYFREYIQRKGKSLYLTAEKLEIFHLFKKQKDE